MYKPKTLVINTWYSKCGDCGENAFPNQSHHDTVKYRSGLYETEVEGCGVQWERLTCDYFGSQDLIDSVKKMRPDLEYYDLFERGADERSNEDI